MDFSTLIFDLDILERGAKKEEKQFQIKTYAKGNLNLKKIPPAVVEAHSKLT